MNESDIRTLSVILSRMEPNALRVVANVMKDFADILEMADCENLVLSNIFSGAIRVYIKENSENG